MQMWSMQGLIMATKHILKELKDPSISCNAGMSSIYQLTYE